MWTGWACLIPSVLGIPSEANDQSPSGARPRTNSTSWQAARGSPSRLTMPPRWNRLIRWWVSFAFTMPVSSIPVLASSLRQTAIGARRAGGAFARSPFSFWEHGQIVGRLVFERLTDPSRPRPTGAGLGSNYQGQDFEAFQTFQGALIAALGCSGNHWLIVCGRRTDFVAENPHRFAKNAKQPRYPVASRPH